MGDFTSLSCPACGGPLKVASQAETLVCEYCGTEHWVHHEDEGTSLEIHAACPTCGKNDKVRKVTAIVAGQQTPLSHLLAAPEQPTVLLAPPSRGIHQIGCSNLAASVAVLVLFIAAVEFLNSRGSLDRGLEYGTLAAIGLLLAFLALALGPFDRQLREKLERDYQQRRTRYDQELQRRTQEAMGPWRRALGRWQLLYYCERDDCVFVPGEGRSVPAPQMDELLKTAGSSARGEQPPRGALNRLAGR